MFAMRKASGEVGTYQQQLLAELARSPRPSGLPFAIEPAILHSSFCTLHFRGPA